MVGASPGGQGKWADADRVMDLGFRHVGIEPIRRQGHSLVSAWPLPQAIADDLRWSARLSRDGAPGSTSGKDPRFVIRAAGVSGSATFGHRGGKTRFPGFGSVPRTADQLVFRAATVQEQQHRSGQGQTLPAAGDRFHPGISTAPGRPRQPPHPPASRRAARWRRCGSTRRTRSSPSRPACRPGGPSATRLPGHPAGSRR